MSFGLKRFRLVAAGTEKSLPIDLICFIATWSLQASLKSCMPKCIKSLAARKYPLNATMSTPVFTRLLLYVSMLPKMEGLK